MSPFRPLFVDAEAAIRASEPCSSRRMRALRHLQVWHRLRLEAYSLHLKRMIEELKSDPILRLMGF